MFKQYEELQVVLSTIFIVVTIAGLGIPLILFLVGKLVEAFSAQQVYEFDAVIQQRMELLELADWKALCQAAGVRRNTLDLLRQGEADRLKLKQLRRLATGLQLSLPDLLKLVQCDDFGQSKSISFAPAGGGLGWFARLFSQG